MVERCLRTAEAVGSNPITSTRLKSGPPCERLRDYPGDWLQSWRMAELLVRGPDVASLPPAHDMVRAHAALLGVMVLCLLLLLPGAAAAAPVGQVPSHVRASPLVKLQPEGVGGRVDVGSSKRVPVSATNVSAVPIRFTEVSVFGFFPGRVAYSLQCLGALLQPAGSCGFTISLHATRQGPVRLQFCLDGFIPSTLGGVSECGRVSGAAR